MKEEGGRMIVAHKIVYHTFLVVVGGFVLSGCVLNEKYEAEKARSLNFQRLLAQEEKRTAELDNEVKRSKKELAEYEARNRELTAQVQAVREQMGRVQEESDALKEAALLERKARTDMKRAASAHKAPPPELVPSSIDQMGSPGAGGSLEEATSAAQAESMAAAPSGGSPTIHIVKPGETLYRISRKY